MNLCELRNLKIPYFHPCISAACLCCLQGTERNNKQNKQNKMCFPQLATRCRSSFTLLLLTWMMELQVINVLWPCAQSVWETRSHEVFVTAAPRVSGCSCWSEVSLFLTPEQKITWCVKLNQPQVNISNLISQKQLNLWRGRALYRDGSLSHRGIKSCDQQTPLLICRWSSWSAFGPQTSHREEKRPNVEMSWVKVDVSSSDEVFLVWSSILRLKHFTLWLKSEPEMF